MYDSDGTARLSALEMKKVLVAMNNTCSFFGDRTLDVKRIDEIIVQLFEEADVDENGKVDFPAYVEQLTKHPSLVSFLTQESA